MLAHYSTKHPQYLIPKLYPCIIGSYIVALIVPYPHIQLHINKVTKFLPKVSKLAS